MPSVSFQSPTVLLGLGLVPLLWLAWGQAARQARRIGEHYGGPKSLSGNPLRGAARLLALVLLIAGTAGPGYLGAGVDARAGTPVVFVLDVSASMEARDAVPDRLAAGRAAVRDLCALVPDACAALVAGGEAAAVVCPPTDDRRAFLAILDQAAVGWMPAGTCVAAGLEAALPLVEREGGAVILVSDGEDHGPAPDEGLEALRRAGAVVHTVTVGTPVGARVDRATPAGGDPPLSRARPQAMAEWARSGGGRAWTAPGGLPARADLVVPPGLRWEAARRRGVLVDLSPWLYAGAALLAALSLRLL